MIKSVKNQQQKAGRVVAGRKKKARNSVNAGASSAIVDMPENMQKAVTEVSALSDEDIAKFRGWKQMCPVSKIRIAGKLGEYLLDSESRECAEEIEYVQVSLAMAGRGEDSDLVPMIIRESVSTQDFEAEKIIIEEPASITPPAPYAMEDIPVEIL